MILQFHRTGDRRYSVVALRTGHSPLRMDSAPGFDKLMPHDLQHLIVEQELNIGNGIFGQLAAGGTAGTFHATADERNPRQRRETAKKGSQLKTAGHDASMFSERATYICWQHWLETIDDPRGLEMKEEAAAMIARSPAAERRRYTSELFQRTDRRMDELSQRWQALAVGEFLEIPWEEEGERASKQKSDPGK